MENGGVIYPLPDVRFGAKPLPDNWDEDETPDDDEELSKTSPDVIRILGFDPLEPPPRAAGE